MRQMICLGILLVFSTLVAAGQDVTFYFPQIADGRGGDLTYRTTGILLNNTSTVATGTVRFRLPDGNPFSVSLKDGRTGDQFSFTLQPNQTLVLETTGAGALRTGYAVVTSSRTLGGTAIFSVFDGAGKLLTEAGVPASSNLSNFTIFVDTRAGFNTGLAVANTGGASSALTTQVRGTDGSPLQVTPSTLVLEPNEHKARFVTEADFGSTPTDIVGSMEVNASSPVSAVTLRIGPGGVLTTTPVVPRAAAAQVLASTSDAVFESVTIGEILQRGTVIDIAVGDSVEPIESFILRFSRRGILIHEQIERVFPGKSSHHLVVEGIHISDFDQVQIRPVFASGLLGKSSAYKK